MGSLEDVVIGFFDWLTGERTTEEATRIKRQNARIRRRLDMVNDQSAVLSLDEEDRKRLNGLKQALNGRK